MRLSWLDPLTGLQVCGVSASATGTLKLHIEQVDRMDTVVWGSSEILLAVELFGAGDRVSRA